MKSKGKDIPTRNVAQIPNSVDESEETNYPRKL